VAIAPGRAAATGAPTFAAWLDDLRQEALARGISVATLDLALTRLAPLPRVLALDRRQPEATLPIDRYLARAVTPARIREGRAHLATHRPLLDGIASRYGVPPPIVVALWGLETSYGRDLGRFPVIAALATLAHDGRRGAVFREELLAALWMLEEGQATLARLRGSWAGAMGQSQFLPSSFRRYAVDHDGDGRADIWGSLPDVFASIANYLAQAGWRGDQSWGHRVRLPPGFDRALADLAIERPIAWWEALGVRRAGGGALAGGGGEVGSIVLPDGGGGGYLVYPNYRVLLGWNRSLLFAAAAGHLADRLAARASLAGEGPSRGRSPLPPGRSRHRPGTHSA
jgi:membrane-bound lytic murein transglycosylase B